MVLELQNINKSFGNVVALKGVNLSVQKGDWVSIMGPSGSGKSTLLNIIALLDEPSGGEYRLMGKSMRDLSEEEKIVIRREKIGLIFQQFHLIPYLTALENVELAQFYHSAVDSDDAKAALEKVGLGHRISHLPSELSGGEQQRLCIARSFINNPDILLADEPTGNLDGENEKIVLEAFCKLRDEGKTIILITHNPELGEYGNKKVLLKHGEML
ncbi:ABC transporter ATP-binding protein [Helicobacter sp. 23-1044]